MSAHYGIRYFSHTSSSALLLHAPNKHAVTMRDALANYTIQPVFTNSHLADMGA